MALAGWIMIIRTGMSVKQGRFMRVPRSSLLTWLRVGSGCDILERKDQLIGSNRVNANVTIS